MAKKAVIEIEFPSEELRKEAVEALAKSQGWNSESKDNPEDLAMDFLSSQIKEQLIYARNQALIQETAKSTREKVNALRIGKL